MEFFGISTGEFLIIVLVGLFAVGPKTLASMLRSISRAIKTLKNYSAKIRENSSLGESLEFRETIPQDFNLDELNPVRTLKNVAREEADAWAHTIFRSNNAPHSEKNSDDAKNARNTPSTASSSSAMSANATAVFEALERAQNQQTQVASTPEPSANHNING